MKSRWRVISRATECITKSMWRTFECWSLKQAGRELVCELRRVRKRQRCLCLRCREPMARPSLVVADAGQFYEVVDKARAVKAVEHLISTLGLERAVAVREGKQKQAYIPKHDFGMKPGFKLLRAQQVRLPAFVCLVPPNDPQRHTYGLLVKVVAPGWERRLAYPSGEIFYYNSTTGACMRVRVVCG